MILALLVVLAQFTTNNTGDLRVTVTDPAGLPLRAAIELSSQGTQVRERAETDASGAATLRR